MVLPPSRETRAKNAAMNKPKACANHATSATTMWKAEVSTTIRKSGIWAAPALPIVVFYTWCPEGSSTALHTQQRHPFSVHSKPLPGRSQTCAMLMRSLKTFRA